MDLQIEWYWCLNKSPSKIVCTLNIFAVINKLINLLPLKNTIKSVYFNIATCVLFKSQKPKRTVLLVLSVSNEHNYLYSVF